MPFLPPWAQIPECRLVDLKEEVERPLWRFWRVGFEGHVRSSKLHIEKPGEICLRNKGIKLIKYCGYIALEK
jgi:hypothetical protein